MLFADRTDAGRQLAAALLRFKDQNPVVLALPRGGVTVGFEIAVALGCPLDLLLVRKIGAPMQPELAVGAVVDGPEPQIVTNEDVLAALDLPKDYVERAAQRELVEIRRRRDLYLEGRERAVLAGATAIVVDDGIATGATARAALRAARRQRTRRLVLAVPVAPPETVAELKGECDEIVCLAQPEAFGAIGFFYNEFHQLDDAEVIRLLDEAAKRRAKP
jgi:putative phosphoribosyl transferase